MKKMLLTALALCVLCATVLCGCEEQTAANVIAEFQYDNADAVAELGLKDNGYGDKDTGYEATSGEGLLFASVDGKGMRKLEWSKDDYDGNGLQAVMTGGNYHPWDKGAYIEVKVSTVGVSKVGFEAILGGTNKGPRDFALQYSVDGTTYTDTGDVYYITDNKRLEQAFSVTLPDEAAGQETLYIRMKVASPATIGGEVSLYGHTGGETAIHRLTVTGE